MSRNSENVAKFRKFREISGISRNFATFPEFREIPESSRKFRNFATFSEFRDTHGNFARYESGIVIDSRGARFANYGARVTAYHRD